MWTGRKGLHLISEGWKQNSQMPTHVLSDRISSIYLGLSPQLYVPKKAILKGEIYYLLSYFQI